jgi:hypothetical protein
MVVIPMMTNSPTENFVFNDGMVLCFYVSAAQVFLVYSTFQALAMAFLFKKKISAPLKVPED